MSERPASAPIGYDGYHVWKGWEELFSYTPDRGDYFSGETRGLAIAGADVLEIGFGSGEFLRWAADRGARVTGTEINEFLVNAARDRGIRVIDSNIELVADQLAHGFDTIVAFDVFEHFTFDELAVRLKACETLLKPEGKLLLRFPNAQSPFGLAPQYGDPTHRVCLSPSAVEHLIRSTKLEIETFGHPYRAKGQSVATRLGRMVRHILRDLISCLLNFTYATQISYDPVVTVVIKKGAAAA